MDIYQQLRDNGFKLTPPRKQVINLLLNHPKDEHPGPLTVQDIFNDLQKANSQIDLVSVYRTLEILVKIGLISQVQFGDGKKRYENLPFKHHHHLVCQSCGNIAEISLPLEQKILQQVQSKTKFNLSSHSMEFFGTCQNCQ